MIFKIYFTMLLLSWINTEMNVNCFNLLNLNLEEDAEFNLAMDETKSNSAYYSLF